MEKIDKLTATDQVTASLKYNILQGNLKPGQKLNQAGLAKSLGVSRLPIRDSLQRLEDLSLVERLETRHVRVIDIDKTMIYENFLLARTSFDQVLDSILKADDVDLYSFLQKYESADDYSLLVAIVNLCANPYLKGNTLSMLASFVEFSLNELACDNICDLNLAIKSYVEEDRDPLDEYFLSLASEFACHWEGLDV